ncbi:hypothetical protein EV1_038228 [Malus domestica]
MPLRYLESTLRQTACDFRKLSMYVTGADTSGKVDASPISKLAFLSSELAFLSFELRRVQKLHVTSADKSGKKDWPVVSEQALLLRKLASLRYLESAL